MRWSGCLESGGDSRWISLTGAAGCWKASCVLHETGQIWLFEDSENTAFLLERFGLSVRNAACLLLVPAEKTGRSLSGPLWYSAFKETWSSRSGKPEWGVLLTRAPGGSLYISPRCISGVRGRVRDCETLDYVWGLFPSSASLVQRLPQGRGRE